MTSSGRVAIAIVALIVGAALAALGSIQHDGASQTTGAAMMTAVLGYAFGDRNGEKRLASAITVLAAEQVSAPADLAPAGAIGTPVTVTTPAVVETTTHVRPADDSGQVPVVAVAPKPRTSKPRKATKKAGK